jgi:transposase
VVFEPTLDRALAPDHPVRLVDQVLGVQDWSAWEARYTPGPGRPAIHPRVMASILLYGLSKGVRTSRKLEEACGNRLDFIWLAEGRVPDHSTLCDFRKAHTAELKALLAEVCRVAMYVGLAALNDLVLDATRVRANSSRHATATAEEIEARLASLRAEIDRRFAEAAAADEAETDLFGERATPYRLPRELADLERRAKRLEEALAAAKAAAARQAEAASRRRPAAKAGSDTEDGGQAAEGAEKAKPPAPRVPVADPASTVLPDKDGGCAPNYTPMVAVEGRGGFIVDADVLADGDEGAAAVPVADRVAETYGEGPQRVVADGAYGSGENLTAFDARGTAAYIPPPRRYDTADNPARRPDPREAVPPEAWDRLPRNPRTQRLDRSAFVYEAGTDTYWCPLGRPLGFVGEHAKHGRPYRRYRTAGSCRDCPLGSACTASRDGRRTVYRDEHERAREAAAARLHTTEGRAIYRRRAPAVETPFGHIKTQMHFRQFLLRGLAGVRAEWLWACVAYNVAKLVRGLSRLPVGVAEALAAWTSQASVCPHRATGRPREPLGFHEGLLASLGPAVRSLGLHRCQNLCAA